MYIGRTSDGKKHYERVTTDTKAEWIYAAAKVREAGIPEEQETITLGEAIDRYIDSCATLSPTTVAGDRKIRRAMFPSIMDMTLEALDADALQKAVNVEMTRKTERRSNLSPKTIRNAYGLISASLRHAGAPTYNIKLPKDAPKFLELPEPAEVIAAVAGTDIELPCMLALWLSLSMSEVRGLKYSSIRHGCLYIDQVVVDVDGHPGEKKRAKVASRNRCLELPGPLLSLIKEQTDYTAYTRGEVPDGYLIPRREDWIRRRLNKLLPGLTFHQLRHLNASVMLQLGVPDKYAMERGGWSTPATMKRVYQHTFSDARRAVDASINEYFSATIQQIRQHEAAKR